MSGYFSDYLPICEKFEAKVPWMYLDTRGFVTVGVGCMLPDADSAARLMFQLPDGPASHDQIVAEFNRVHAMARAMGTNYYKGTMWLPDAVIDSELIKRVMICDTGLRQRMSDFEDLPYLWKMALLDMAFNLGLGGLFGGYPRFLAAVRAGNGQAAAAQCHRNGPSMPRNDWTRTCFWP
jgi:GH24 family phage-related lysozyme (muramidase)